MCVCIVGEVVFENLGVKLKEQKMGSQVEGSERMNQSLSGAMDRRDDVEPSHQNQSMNQPIVIILVVLTSIHKNSNLNASRATNTIHSNEFEDYINQLIKIPQ